MTQTSSNRLYFPILHRKFHQLWTKHSNFMSPWGPSSFKPSEVKLTSFSFKEECQQGSSTSEERGMDISDLRATSDRARFDRRHPRDGGAVKFRSTSGEDTWREEDPVGEAAEESLTRILFRWEQRPLTRSTAHYFMGVMQKGAVATGPPFT